MEYVTRLASADVATRYPLKTDGHVEWHNPAPAIWTLELPLPDIPQGHIIVPSFAMLPACDTTYAYQFTLHAQGEYALQPVPVSSADSSAAKSKSTRQGQPLASCHIDCWHTEQALQASYVALTLTSTVRPDSYLLCLSCRPLEAEPGRLPVDNVQTAIPANISQLEAQDAIKHRICSPTALTMALSTFVTAPSWQDTITACYDPLTRAYGAWPLAIQWASRHGIIGAVEVFSDWVDAIRCLRAGVPMVCSIRFAKGALQGAPLEQTGGHLVLLYGVQGGKVLVKDPAAKIAADVPRHYSIEQFSAAWLSRRGAAYVFSSSALPAPTTASQESTRL